MPEWKCTRLRLLKEMSGDFFYLGLQEILHPLYDHFLIFPWKGNVSRGGHMGSFPGNLSNPPVHVPVRACLRVCACVTEFP